MLIFKFEIDGNKELCHADISRGCRITGLSNEVESNSDKKFRFSFRWLLDFPREK